MLRGLVTLAAVFLIAANFTMAATPSKGGATIDPHRVGDDAVVYWSANENLDHLWVRVTCVDGFYEPESARTWGDNEWNPVTIPGIPTVACTAELWDLQSANGKAKFWWRLLASADF